MSFSQFLGNYLADAAEGFQAVNRALLTLESTPDRKESFDDIFRALHTLKASSTMLEFSDIAELAHAAEGLLDRIRRAPTPASTTAVALLFEVTDTLETMVRQRSGAAPATDAPGSNIAELIARIEEYAEPGQSQPSPRVLEEPAPPASSPATHPVGTIRVSAHVLDGLFDQVGELTLIKNRIANLVFDTPNKGLRGAVAALRHLVDAMQDTISVARLVRVSEVLAKFPRMARDLARAAGKELDLTIEGGETEIDKAVLDTIGEPLLHLVRNAVDHGIEPPNRRLAQGKPQRGRIRVAVRRTESHILIEVDDDGDGLRLDEIRDAAVRKGLVGPAEAAALDERHILNLVFNSGVSTASEVTGLSGRGVGLRIVNTAARELGGLVQVKTAAGRGTRFTLQLPLTTVVAQMLVVRVGEQLFGIPSEMVVETLRLKATDIRRIYEDAVVLRRNEAIPFIRLDEKLGIAAEPPADTAANAVVIRRGRKAIVLSVHEVISQMENIVKPLDPYLRQFKGFSGSTVLSDGRLALLLDVPSLFGFEALEGDE